MQGLRIQGKDCPYNPRAFPPLHTEVQVPRSTGQGLLLQSSCIPAIHGGQMCKSSHPGGQMPEPTSRLVLGSTGIKRPAP
jgi:hypothetical protein